MTLRRSFENNHVPNHRGIVGKTVEKLADIRGIVFDRSDRFSQLNGLFTLKRVKAE